VAYLRKLRPSLHFSACLQLEKHFLLELYIIVGNAAFLNVVRAITIMIQLQYFTLRFLSKNSNYAHVFKGSTSAGNGSGYAYKLRLQLGEATEASFQTFVQ
jgi:hypothetical protein